MIQLANMTPIQVQYLFAKRLGDGAGVLVADAFTVTLWEVTAGQVSTRYNCDGLGNVNANYPFTGDAHAVFDERTDYGGWPALVEPGESAFQWLLSVRGMPARADTSDKLDLDVWIVDRGGEGVRWKLADALRFLDTLRAPAVGGAYALRTLGPWVRMVPAKVRRAAVKKKIVKAGDTLRMSQKRYDTLALRFARLNPAQWAATGRELVQHGTSDAQRARGIALESMAYAHDVIRTAATGLHQAPAIIDPFGQVVSGGAVPALVATVPMVRWLVAQRLALPRTGRSVAAWAAEVEAASNVNAYRWNRTKRRIMPRNVAAPVAMGATFQRVQLPGAGAGLTMTKQSYGEIACTTAVTVTPAREGDAAGFVKLSLRNHPDKSGDDKLSVDIWIAQAGGHFVKMTARQAAALADTLRFDCPLHAFALHVPAEKIDAYTTKRLARFYGRLDAEKRQVQRAATVAAASMAKRAQHVTQRQQQYIDAKAAFDYENAPRDAFERWLSMQQPLQGLEWASNQGFQPGSAAVARQQKKIDALASVLGNYQPLALGLVGASVAVPQMDFWLQSLTAAKLGYQGQFVYGGTAYSIAAISAASRDNRNAFLSLLGV